MTDMGTPGPQLRRTARDTARDTLRMRTPWAAWTAAGMVMLIAVLATVTLGRPEDLRITAAPGSGALAQEQAAGDASPGAAGGGPAATGAAAGVAGSGATGGSGGSGKAAAKAGGPSACAPGRNGGSTDVGVTGNQVKLAATVVKHGVGEAFLGDVEFGMLAAMNKANRGGGVCGRELSLTLNDDGWDPTTGQQDLRNYISEGYFALAVVPSSEGLNQAVKGGDIDRAGIPVVGTDGMIASQYTDPWVWPVSTSTISFMHIMAKNAAARGQCSSSSHCTFAIVYDNNYRFGVEGDKAFAGAVSRLPGVSIPSGCDKAIQGGQSSYTNEVSTFNGACGEQSSNPVDFVALLLEPETAAQWIKDGGYLGTKGKAVGAGGPQTLFTYGFGQDFASNCAGVQCTAKFWVWTGFHPPIPPDDTVPAVSTYVNDLAVTNGQADKDNQFVEGGYLGMELLLKGLQKVGPDLTRAALKQALDSMTYDSGLTGGPESWASGHHFADVSAQAFSLVESSGSFDNFRSEQTGFLADPWVGQDT